MTRRIIRDESWAIINKENRIRVLLQSEVMASKVAYNLSRELPSLSPYRVIRVLVEELEPELLVPQI